MIKSALSQSDFWEMMCRSEILFERRYFSILRGFEKLRVWCFRAKIRHNAALQNSYLILLLELLHEDWSQRLLNQGHHSPLCVQCIDFEFIIKTLNL